MRHCTRLGDGDCGGKRYNRVNHNPVVKYFDTSVKRLDISGAETPPDENTA